MSSFCAVEMIKQFPENAHCSSLSFHGDVVYIGLDLCVIQWNIVTDAVVRLDGSNGLLYDGSYISSQFHFYLSSCLQSDSLP
jgi:hypothetical protein